MSRDYHHLDNFEDLDILHIAAAPGTRLVLVTQLLEALLLTNERLVLYLLTNQRPVLLQLTNERPVMSQLTDESWTHLTLLHLDHLPLHQAAPRSPH